MNVVILDGIMGAGKTLGMTILVKYFQAKSGCALYSNYGVEGSKEIADYRDFLSVAKEKSSLIALDESHVDLDARNFSANSVKFFTHIVFYLRKMRATLFLATPDINNLDGRVLAVCNLYCRCSKDKNFFYYDMFDIQANRHLKRYKIKRESAFDLGEEFYDTEDIVTPLEFPSDRNEWKSFLHELKAVINSHKTIRRRRNGGAIGFRPERVAVQTSEEVIVS